MGRGTPEFQAKVVKQCSHPACKLTRGKLLLPTLQGYLQHRGNHDQPFPAGLDSHVSGIPVTLQARIKEVLEELEAWNVPFKPFFEGMGFEWHQITNSTSHSAGLLTPFLSLSQDSEDKLIFATLVWDNIHRCLQSKRTQICNPAGSRGCLLLGKAQHLMHQRKC